jgi:hypothetical protein
MRTDVTSCTIPGTLKEIMVFIVRKEKSSSIFQMYWTNRELQSYVIKYNLTIRSWLRGNLKSASFHLSMMTQ